MIPDKIKSMEFILTDACNLKCTYCHVRKSIYRMSIGQAQKHLDYIKRNFDGFRGYSLSLFGGEPLLNWGTCRYIIDAHHDLQTCSEIVLFTNGVMLEDKHLNYCRDNGVTVQISFDAYHSDYSRPAHMGKAMMPTYIKLISELKDEPWVRFAYTVSPRFADHLPYVYTWYLNNYHVIPHMGIVKAPPSKGADQYWDLVSAQQLHKAHAELCNIYAQRAIDYNETPSTPIIDYYLRRLLAASVGNKLPPSCAGSRISFYGDSMYHCLLQRQAMERDDLVIREPRSFEECSTCEIKDICDCGCLYSYCSEDNRRAYCYLQKGLYANIVNLMRAMRGVPQWNKVVTRMIKEGSEHESELCPHCD